MVRLIKRQAPRPPGLARRHQLVAGEVERSGDLVAAGALTARDLGVRTTAPDTPE